MILRENVFLWENPYPRFSVNHQLSMMKITCLLQFEPATEPCLITTYCPGEIIFNFFLITLIC